MHWHEDIQFIYVLDGQIEVITSGERIPLYKGDGIFINKNVPHLVNKIDACHYNSFIFPDYFVKFYAGNPAGSIVEDITDNDNIQTFYIADISQNQNVLNIMKSLSLEQSTASSGTPCGIYNQSNKITQVRQYRILLALCNLWLEFYHVACITANKIPQKPDRLSSRMNSFLRYIELNYSGNISLDTIAQSANVSKSECLRCFRSSLQTPPYRYLTEYRRKYGKSAN